MGDSIHHFSEAVRHIKSAMSEVNRSEQLAPLEIGNGVTMVMNALSSGLAITGIEVGFPSFRDMFKEFAEASAFTAYADLGLTTLCYFNRAKRTGDKNAAVLTPRVDAVLKDFCARVVSGEVACPDLIDRDGGDGARYYVTPEGWLVPHHEDTGLLKMPAEDLPDYSTFTLLDQARLNAARPGDVH